MAIEDRDILVVAFDSQTGNELWRKQLGQPERDDAANAIAAQGSRVFVAGMITTEEGDEDLYVTALDAETGNVLWEYQFDLAGDDDAPSAIAVQQGRVFVAGRAKTAAGDEDLLMWALHEETGALLWYKQFDLEQDNTGDDDAISLEVNLDRVIVSWRGETARSDRDTVVTALDTKTGDVLWRKERRQ